MTREDLKKDILDGLKGSQMGILVTRLTLDTLDQPPPDATRLRWVIELAMECRCCAGTAVATPGAFWFFRDLSDEELLAAVTEAP